MIFFVVVDISIFLCRTIVVHFVVKGLSRREIIARLSMTFTANGKRQTAKMKLLPSLFSCVYSGVKLFVFAMNSRRRYSIFVCFIYGLEEKNSKSEVTFPVFRLPVNVMLNLSITVLGPFRLEIR